MENGFLILHEKDWEKMTPEQQGWATFNTMQSMNKRLQNLEKRPLFDKCWSFLGGVVGGFCAALGIRWGV